MVCDDETDWESDMPCVPSQGITYDPTDSEHGCCGTTPTALLAGTQRDDLGPNAGNLWDPNQGGLRELHDASEGYLRDLAAMTIMTVMHPTRVVRFYIMKTCCVLANGSRDGTWGAIVASTVLYVVSTKHLMTSASDGSGILLMSFQAICSQIPVLQTARTP